MIVIAGKPMEADAVAGLYPRDSLEGKIANAMFDSSETYKYSSVDQLKFELSLRASIVNAAKDLSRSGIGFRDFRKSKANPDYWQRTSEGGFQLQSGVKPYDAINDIYKNGSLYGTECATAMVIVFYKALADVLPEELFNKMFSDIYLMDWQHLDSDLGISTTKRPADYFPGDSRYFKNPDVDPLTPQWQGENVIDLGGGRYYGHGIGITSANSIIDALNSARVDDSDTPAYLMDQVERPDYKGLYKQYSDYMSRQHATQATIALKTSYSF
jgi:protein-glutamine gamma-glutamyltransferase